MLAIIIANALPSAFKGQRQLAPINSTSSELTSLAADQ